MRLQSPAELMRAAAQRGVRRVRNGVRHIAGVNVPVGLTPKTEIWREGRARLWRYIGNGEQRHGPPVMIVPSLVSHSWILDLYPGNSYVERMLDRGFTVYLLDFGTPDARDAANSLTTYVDEMLPAAAERARVDSGSAELSYLGYCMGGNLLLLSLASNAESLAPRCLVTMATPVDLWEVGFVVRMFLGDRMDPTSLLDATGNVPADVLRRGFKMLKPTADAAQAATLVEHLDDSQYLRGYYAMDRWVSEHIPFPGAAFIETVHSIVQPNAFMHERPVIGGRPRPWRDIECPTLVVVAEEDYVVPIAAAAPLEDMLGGPVTMLRLPYGHVGLVAGRVAATQSVPRILDWLEEQSSAA